MASIYRKTLFAELLQDSIDELNEQNPSISSDLEAKLLAHFDRLFLNALETQVKAKGTFGGHCHTYSEPGPSTYSFVLEKAHVKLTHYPLDESIDVLKIICPEYEKKAQKTKKGDKDKVENPKKKKKE